MPVNATYHYIALPCHYIALPYHNIANARPTSNLILSRRISVHRLRTAMAASTNILPTSLYINRRRQVITLPCYISTQPLVIYPPTLVIYPPTLVIYPPTLVICPHSLPAHTPPPHSLAPLILCQYTTPL